MKIAIYHNLPSGGAKRALYEMARRLVSAHKIDVYTLSTADHNFCDLRSRARRYTVHPFEPAPLFESPFGRLNQWQRARDLTRLGALGRQIADEINGGDYDVAFLHHCMFSQAPMLLPYLKVPSVYYCQEPLRFLYEPSIPRPYQNGNGLRSHIDRIDPLIRAYHERLRVADRQATRAAGVVLANSRFSQSNIDHSYGLSSHVVYLGVDASVFSPKWELEREDYFLSVGALRPNKGFDFLIDALALLPAAQRFPLRLITNIDDAAEEAFLRNRAERAGVTLHIETAISDETLLDHYRRTQLVIYAPVREPFGFVPLESMACGTPVVGVAEGGLLETIVDGRTGLLVERNPGKFADAVQMLLANEALRDAMGRQGREHVARHWSWGKSVQALERHLFEAASLPAVVS